MKILLTQWGGEMPRPDIDYIKNKTFDDWFKWLDERELLTVGPIGAMLECWRKERDKTEAEFCACSKCGRDLRLPYCTNCGTKRQI